MHIGLWQAVACQENLCYDEDTFVLTVIISLADAHRRKQWQDWEVKP